MDQPSATRDRDVRDRYPALDVQSHDLPANQDSSYLTDLEEQYERKVDGNSGRAFVTIILIMLAANIIHDVGLLPRLSAYMVAYGVAAVIEYWIPPRPPQSFLSWILKIAGVLLNVYVGLVTVPESLREWLPMPIAYGLPAFAVFIIFYWVPPLYPIRRKTPLWKWILGAAVCALIWGWAGPIMSK